MDKRYVTIDTSISQDGLGVPVISLYFSYCDKKDETGYFCTNCHNNSIQKDGVGFNLTFNEIVEIVDDKLFQMEKLLGRDVGVCFLGGEPFAEINRGMVMKLSEYYKDRFQITYTWREKEQVDSKWIKYIDKIVCGEYNDNLKDEDYLLGSTNQYVIDGNKNIILEYEGEIE